MQRLMQPVSKMFSTHSLLVLDPIIPSLYMLEFFFAIENNIEIIPRLNVGPAVYVM